MNRDLKNRPKGYAFSVIRLSAALPKRTEAQIMGRQLLRCGTSVGAHRYFDVSRIPETSKYPRRVFVQKPLERTENIRVAAAGFLRYLSFRLREASAMGNRDTVPIDNSILVVRGHRVILAADLAKIYGVETRVLNQAVKRHRERFPMDFTFRLSRDEAAAITASRSQSVILKRGEVRAVKNVDSRLFKKVRMRGAREIEERRRIY